MNNTKKTIKKQSKNTRMSENDINLILYELDAVARQERSYKLTWEALELFSGYSRQSLWAKPEIKARYAEVKSIKRPEKQGNNQYRQILEQRIKGLEDKIAELKKQENAWLELWARGFVS